jgi:hypothetical protein
MRLMFTQQRLGETVYLPYKQGQVRIFISKKNNAIQHMQMPARALWRQI